MKFLLKIIFTVGAFLSSHAFADANSCPPESEGVPCRSGGDPTNSAYHFRYGELLSCAPDSGDFFIRDSFGKSTPYKLIFGLAPSYLGERYPEKLPQRIMRNVEGPSFTKFDSIFRPSTDRQFTFALVTEKDFLNYYYTSDIGISDRLNDENGVLRSNLKQDDFRIIRRYYRTSFDPVTGEIGNSYEARDTQYLVNVELPQQINLELKQYTASYHGQEIFKMRLNVEKVNTHIYKGIYSAFNRDGESLRTLNVTCRSNLMNLEEYTKSVGGTLIND